jgi:TRAP-type C4-dicarboxylate transport system permease small subunit
MKLIEIQLMADIVMTAIDFNMAYAQAALPLGWGLIVIRIVQNWMDRWRSGTEGYDDTTGQQGVEAYGE